MLQLQIDKDIDKDEEGILISIKSEDENAGRKGNLGLSIWSWITRIEEVQDV